MAVHGDEDRGTSWWGRYEGVSAGSRLGDCVQGCGWEHLGWIFHLEYVGSENVVKVCLKVCMCSLHFTSTILSHSCLYCKPPLNGFQLSLPTSINATLYGEFEAKRSVVLRRHAKACPKTAGESVPNHALNMLNERQRKFYLQGGCRRKGLVKVPQVRFRLIDTSLRSAREDGCVEKKKQC